MVGSQMASLAGTLKALQIRYLWCRIGLLMDVNMPAELTRHLVFQRLEWAKLRASTPLTLSDDDLEQLHSRNEVVSLTEVSEVYLPLSRLLNLHVAAARTLARVKDAFLGQPGGHAPYVIGIAGSVAVGKSTFARVLRALLARWPDHPHVELVTTDGFLHPNHVLEARGLMSRKGFPESYDLRRMIRFLADIKAGARQVIAPVYSHQSYDIVPGEAQIVAQPDVLIFEGLNVLQTAPSAVVASDFFDFSVYVDAEESDIETWYIERFLLLQRTAFQNPTSFFHRYKDLEESAARHVAHDIWSRINLLNLRENILPTRERARLVVRKQPNHAAVEVWLRQM
jgi:type I pantothenate kinase